MTWRERAACATADPASDERFDAALTQAVQLVGLVHGDGDRNDVTRLLNKADWPALAVALAALVPDDQPVSKLLRWTAPPSRSPAVWATDEERAAHAAYSRGVRTAAVVAGEREYARRRASFRRNGRVLPARVLRNVKETA